MNANDTTETFEQFAESIGAATDPKRNATARALWDQEQAARRSYPTTIPPCPSWCTLPPGHEYDSWYDDQDGTAHTRFHEAPVGLVTVTCFEKNGAAGVKRIEFGVTWEREEFATAERAREIASDLLLAADLLDNHST